MTRETVMMALLERLEKSADFKSIGRRMRAPESFGPQETPALMLLDHSEQYGNSASRQPSVHRMMAQAYVYSDVGTDENAIPAATINTILDRIDALLAPDNSLTGLCTLGGLVESVRIDGTIVKAPGDVTGKSIAIVPLDILLP